MILSLKTIALEIGGTTLRELNAVQIPNGCRIFAKEELNNPTGSHYDRVYLTLFQELESSGTIKRGRTPLIEVSSGSSGRSFARFCHLLGYHGTVVVPPGLPKPRLDEITKWGATLIESPSPGIAGAIGKLRMILAADLSSDTKEKLYCVNHAGDARSISALEPIGNEVKADLAPLPVDCFVGAFGNGTSILGIGKGLKVVYPSIEVVCCEPVEAAPLHMKMLGEKAASSHEEGWTHEVLGTGVLGVKFRFLNSPLLPQVVDKSLLISRSERACAFDALHKQEHLRVGPSTALCLAGALMLARKSKNKTFLIVAYDSWRYYDDSWNPNKQKA